jgi:prevent-host-death family protein
MSDLTVSEARARLPELLDRVAEGEEITITRHGRAVAVVVQPDSLRFRRAEATIRRSREIGQLLAMSRDQPLAPAEVSQQRADELVRALRDARDQS